MYYLVCTVLFSNGQEKIFIKGIGSRKLNQTGRHFHIENRVVIYCTIYCIYYIKLQFLGLLAVYTYTVCTAFVLNLSYLAVLVFFNVFFIP